MEEKVYITFGILAFGILVAPVISNIIKIPLSIGEILFGISLAFLGINKILDYSLISPFSYFGFLLLMFLAGLEIKIKELKDLSFEDLIFICLPVILNFIFALIFTFILKLPYIYILVFSLISVGIVVSILREMDLFKTEFGKNLFFIGILGEAFSLFLLTIFSLIFKFKYPILFLKEIFLLIFVAIIAYLMLKFIYLLVWWFPNKFFVIFTKDSSEFGVRLSLGVLLILSSIFGFANIEPILGAFIAGLIFGNVIHKDDILEEKFSGFSYGFFIPLFFMNIGINFEFPHTDILYVIKLLFYFLLIKILSFLPLSVKYGFKSAIASAFLMSAPLTLLIAISEFARSLGIIDQNQANILILLSIITGLICPIVFKFLYKSSFKVQNTT